MQNVRNQNLLKLWLSFFCLSLANALASDSVGKIHAVHVNEVIRIKIIQSQRSSLWNICTGSLMDICHSIPGSKEGLWMPKHKAGTELHLCTCGGSLPTLPRVTPTMGMFPTGGPDSARYLRTTKCWNPAYLLLGLHRYPRTRGTACSWHCCLPRMWHRQDSEALLTLIKAASFCGTRVHASPQHSRDNLSDLLKIVYFSSYTNCSYYMKEKKKKVKNWTLFLAIKLENDGFCVRKSMLHRTCLLNSELPFTLLHTLIIDTLLSTFYYSIIF